MTARLSGFAGRARQAVPTTARHWVQPIEGSPNLPLHVKPVADVDLAAWATQHAAAVDQWLFRYGAVLFRGFRVNMETFGIVATALAGTALAYRERSSPRTELGPGVYSSTEYPADQPIPLHNENSYQHTFPARLVFGCIQPPQRGGVTPLADCRRLLAHIDPAILAEFTRRGVCYTRTYSDGGTSLGMSWQESFQLNSRGEVNAYCRSAGIEAQWLPYGRLRTRQVRPAVAMHPDTRERVWFNHAAFFHVSTLESSLGDGLRNQVGVAHLPSNTYYGDGAEIERETLAAIRRAYAHETVSVPWQRGDVLLVDNLLVAHGREPFTPPRRVVVSMARELTHADLPPVEGRTP